MAVSAKSYFSNSIIGTPQVGADIDIQDTSTTPKFPVGFGFERADGSKFRYAHFGLLTNRGTVAATDISESSATYTSIATLSKTFITPSGDNVAVNSPGARRLQLLITATDNQFYGGYALVYNLLSGTGYSYHIAGNTATNIPETGYCYVELYDPLVTVIDTTTALSIAGCPWANMEPATTTDRIVGGVAVVGHTAGSFGWVQTKGPASCLTDAAIPAIGNPVTLSSTTTGAITQVPVSSSGSVYLLTQILGNCMIASSSTNYSLVNLSIE